MKCSFRLCALLAGLTLAVAAPPQSPATPGADLAKLIHSSGLDPTECYRVRDLSFFKEDIKFYFNEGYLIFSKPVNGERISAAFSADVEGGDGEVLLLPPYRGERQSLAKFTQSPNMDEHFNAALLVFSDGSAQALLDRITRENLGRKVPEMGPLLVDQWSPVLSNVVSGFELRLVQDLLTPQPARLGLVFAAIAGRQLGSFDLLYSGRAREQILAGQLGERNGRPAYDIWTNFEARSSRMGAASAPDAFTTDSIRIDAALDTNVRMTATVRVAMKVGANPIRALPFSISRAMQVTGARIDGAPAELLFLDSVRGQALRYDENEPFLLLPPNGLSAASVHQIEFDEEGSVISPAGNDVYYVGARSNWYPRSEGDLATYDLTFRYPKRLTLVTPGDVTEDRVEGDWRITRRVTAAPIRMAGFNLGDYQKIAGVSPGFHVEVYGNKSLETALQPKPNPALLNTGVNTEAGRSRPVRQAPALPFAGRPSIGWPGGSRSSGAAADRGRRRIVRAPILFRTVWTARPKKPDRLADSRRVWPGFPGFGVSFDPGVPRSERASPASRGPREQVFYSDLLDAHEVAHQWWGDVVLTAGAQDEWISEALADYSALLYLEKRKGAKAMEDVLGDYRDTLVKKDAEGNGLESAGPITWGFRLESAGSAEAWRAITYDKGAWIFHMLRRRLGDAQFLRMLAELRRRFESRPLSTAGLRELVKEYLPPKVRPPQVDAFFDNWVYSSGIPALRLRYTVKGVAPSVKLTGQVEQSGVDDDFSVEAPVEIQFAKGPSQTIWVETSNSAVSFSATLKQVPAKVSIPVGKGVLAVKK